MSDKISTDEVCDGLCVSGADVGVPSAGVAYAHPGCPLHDPESVCGCGQPDRCMSPSHGQLSLVEALKIRHSQSAERPGFWGHDKDWCRDCQDGCGEAYGGPCHCCAAWWREEADDAP